jgi:hypothetical protein
VGRATAYSRSVWAAKLKRFKAMCELVPYLAEAMPTIAAGARPLDVDFKLQTFLDLHKA